MALIDIIYNIEDEADCKYESQEQFINTVNEYGFDEMNNYEEVCREGKIVIGYYKDLYGGKNLHLAKAIAEALWPVVGTDKNEDKKQWIKEVAKEWKDILKKKFWTLPILSE